MNVRTRYVTEIPPYECELPKLFLALINVHVSLVGRP
jgi:hypothetical protein